MTASTVGAPKDKGRGWQMALKYALGDSPQPVILEPRRVGGKEQDESYETLPLFKN